MRKLFSLMREELTQGSDVILATVLAGSGSTPRGAGARMLVTCKGRIFGTIGGGAIEHRSERMALELLSEKRSLFESFQLRKNEIRDLGMVCGGDATVFFQYIAAGDAAAVSLAERIEALYARGEDSWLIVDISGSDGAASVYGRQSGLFGSGVPDEVIRELPRGSGQITAGGRVFYCERLESAGKVYIFGGGHVAQALAPALAAVDFRAVILEDREDFCKIELFPGAEETRLIDNSRIDGYISVTSDDYVVIMTRGHAHDQLIMAQALKTPARYIGVIGSARKKAAVFANLREMGFTDADLRRITTPIGLDIKAETPAEIAVSITAELIKERAVK